MGIVTVENSKEDQLQEYLLLLKTNFTNDNKEDLWEDFEKNFPEGVKLTIGNILNFLNKKSKAITPTCFANELKVLAIAINDVSHLRFCRTNNNKLKKRKHEKNPINNESRTVLEHFLLVGFYALRNVHDDLEGKNNHSEIKTRLEESERVIPRFNSVILLASLFHDTIEDWGGFTNPTAETKIRQIIAKYKFKDKDSEPLNLEKFVIPIVRLLTHNKDTDDTENYLNKLKNPPAEIFKDFDLTKTEKEAIATLAIEIKCADIEQNLTSPQSTNSQSKNKDYLDFLKTHRPNWISGLSETQLERIAEFNPDVLTNRILDITPSYRMKIIKILDSTKN